MITSQYIENKINRFAKGYIFTYRDFLTNKNNREAIIKQLNRMVVSGKINKISKGKYYKAEITVFGNLLPQQQQVLKDLLEKDGKYIAYITGNSYYNAIGLTNQVNNTISIAKNKIRPAIQRGRFKIVFVKQENIITKTNIPLLRLLDAIRNIKKIPDAQINITCLQLMKLVEKLNNKQLNLIQKLAIKYNPATRALLGAIIEQIDIDTNTTILYNSLNPITIYKLSISNDILSTAKNWNIK